MAHDCYIFDIDGTLADNSHRQSFISGEKKDWRGFFACCDKDQPIFPIINLSLHLYEAGMPVVLITGRSMECSNQTEQWLKKYGVQHCGIYFRAEGDHRPDHEVKSELMDQLIADGFSPLMVFDDRNSVVKMWRARGIPCAQVAEGDF